MYMRDGDVRRRGTLLGADRYGQGRREGQVRAKCNVHRRECQSEATMLTRTGKGKDHCPAPSPRGMRTSLGLAKHAWRFLHAVLPKKP